MSDTLWGVVIGGAIASVGPIASLIAERKRWKLERRLELLREERARLEQLIAETLPKLGEAMQNNSYPSHMSSDIVALMPKNVSDLFMKWMSVKPKDELKAKHALFDLALEMKKCVIEIDKKISKLLGGA